MTRAIRLGIVVAVLTMTAWSHAVTRAARQQSDAAAPPPATMIATYCAGCHSEAVRAGGVAFDPAMLTAVHEHADLWETVVRKLRGRLMPPPGARQPTQAEIDAFVTRLEAALDVGAAAGPVAGHAPIQRLTRTELATAIADLLDVEIDAAALLPAEIQVHGFDNIATALTMSPAFVDQYVTVARHAARLAIGAAPPRVTSVHYPVPDGDQSVHIDGLPLGTRGGMRFRHHFPAEGEYRLAILSLGVDLYTYAVETQHTLVILIGDREVFRASIGGMDDLRMVDRDGPAGRAALMQRFADIPVRVAAGTHDVVVTFIERARVESDGFVADLPGDEFSRGHRAPRLAGGVQLVGPFAASGASDTPSRRRVILCRPSPGEESPCARRIAEQLARRAFRRPVTEDDLDSLMPHFDRGRVDGGSFDAGVEQLVAAVLVSPDFLYRAIRTPADAPGDRAFPLSDLELASRLSFFLWSQGPDEELLEIADAGRLRAPAMLRSQAQRMLRDARAGSLVRNFALRWLDLDALGDVQPDPDLFPTFSESLRRDMVTEIESFLASVLLEDRSTGDLLTADHTFLNERLARHYGITSVLGPQFRRVRLADPRRWGLLGKAAVLLRTSYGNRTSPVVRGAWVMDTLMGTPPTPPPPDVETDLSGSESDIPMTLRARLESHRANPGCNQCHGVIDPIGLALENFDAIGRWREWEEEADAPIDGRTVLPSGRRVDGPAELRDALFADRDVFVRAFTEKLMMYALGRELAPHDMPQVRAVVREAAADEYRLSAMVSGIVTSDAFRMQAPAPRR